MPANTETSVLSSLRQLRTIEAARIAEEEQARVRAAEAAERAARRRLEEQAEAAEQARLERSRHRQERIERERERERQQRMAIELEAVRIRQESETRLAAESLRREAELRALDIKARRPAGLIALALFLTCACFALSLLLWRNHGQRASAVLEHRIDKQGLLADLSLRDSQLAELQRRYAKVQDELQMARGLLAQKPAPAATTEPRKRRTARPVKKTREPSTDSRAADIADCDPSDPIACIPD